MELSGFIRGRCTSRLCSSVAYTLPLFTFLDLEHYIGGMRVFVVLSDNMRGTVSRPSRGKKAKANVQLHIACLIY